MFDLGFSELVVIAVVLLIVVGPERLPGVARTAGHLFGRMQRYISDVKTDIRREMQFEELKKLQEQARELEQSLQKGMGEIQSDVQEALSLSEDKTSEAAALPQEAGAAEGADIGGTQEPQPEPEPEVSAPAATVPEKPVDSI
jgi:sec-independent protein translocase protein TatB